MYKLALLYILKGMIIGSAMLIPGFSGGTTAIILGVYDKLVSAVGSFFKRIKENLFVLFTIGIGGLLGILLFSKAILFITGFFRIPMMFLFMGAALGSIPMLFKKAKIKKFSIGTIIYPLIGAASVLLIELLPEGLLKFDTNITITDYLILLMAGVVLSIALVLPGISFSYMLLVLGIYEPTLLAIERREILFLAVLASGVLIGIFLTTKLLEKAMTNHTQATYLLIIGFVLVSLREVFPGIPIGMELVSSILTFVSGFGLVFILSRSVNE